MNRELRNKLQKVYALVEQGATEGERQAARTQLEKMLKKYNISDDRLSCIEKDDYSFTYTSYNEIRLLQQIAKVIGGLDVTWYRYTSSRAMEAYMTYMEFITIQCAYEYFRRHMKQEWQSACAKILKRCRSVKTRNEKRKLLQISFLSEYLLLSNLYTESDLNTSVDSKLTQKQRDAMNLVNGVNGGTYNKQMTNGLLLEF
jgi:hypothetical protein